MKKLGSVLVVLDKPKHTQSALDKALRLQAASGAHLHLVSFCWNAMCEQKEVFDAHQRRTLKKEIVRQREDWLHGLVLDAGLSAADVTIELAWTRDIAQWVAQCLGGSTHGLVVKSVRHSESLLHTPLDWELIRLAPAPVLLASPVRAKQGKDVLASIDLRHNDQKHRTLNFRVLDAAGQFAEFNGGRVHCVAAIEHSEILSDLDFISVRKVRRKVIEETRDLLSAMLEPYAIPASRVHRPTGKVGQVVAATARKINSDLIVVGSAARRGRAAGVLLGNSAEKILTRAPCDVLTVHP